MRVLKCILTFVLLCGLVWVLRSYYLAQNQSVHVVAVGDMMFGGKATPFLEQKGYDFPFAATAHLLREADIAIGNLETPLTDRGEPLVDKQYAFRNPPAKVAPALKRAGLDIVSLANNHSMDYGVQGLLDTMTALDDVGIRHLGAGTDSNAARRAVIFELSKGGRVGFLAYSNTLPEEFWAKANQAGTAFGHEAHVRADVSSLLANNVDVIVVSFHWGREREAELQPYQILLAHAAIDAGADAVIGHHPHILQAIEQYGEGIILYGLGNYTFGTFSEFVDSSVIANIIFREGAFSRLELTPIKVNNFIVQLQPQKMSAKEAKNVLKELRRLSGDFGKSLTYDSRSGLIVYTR